MKTTGVSDIPKFGLLVFLGHPNEETKTKSKTKTKMKTKRFISKWGIYMKTTFCTKVEEKQIDLSLFSNLYLSKRFLPAVMLVRL